MTFEQWLQARSMKESDLDPDALLEQRAEYDREQTAKRAAAGQDEQTSQQQRASGDSAGDSSSTDADGDDDAQRSASDPAAAAQRAVSEERQRVNDIHAQGTENSIPAAVIERCQREGLDIDGARQVFLEHIKTARPPSVGAVNIHVRHGNSDCDIEVFEAAISLRAGVPVSEASLTRKTRRTHIDPEMAERGDRFSDMSAIEMCRHALELEGITVPRGKQQLIRAAISTASLANILENVMNKQVAGAFMESENTAREWVRMTDVPDFKPNSRVRASEAENFAKVNNGGEVEFGSVEDIKESFSVEQFAQLMIFPEQDIINDDLNAISDTPRKMAQAASRIEQDKVYGVLLSNPTLNQNPNALFSAANNNLQTGASSALSAASLAILIQDLTRQKDIKDSLINIRPMWFLYGSPLWFTAQQLVRSTEVRSKGSTDADNVGTNNPIQGVGLRTILEPRLSEGTPAVGDTSAQSGTDTQFYVFGGSGQVPTFELAFIRGTGRSPRIEQVQLPANILGIGWRGVHSFGVGVLDFRGMQKSDGV